MKASDKKYRASPKGKAQKLRWETKNRARRAAQRKARRDPERERDTYLQRTYGITLADERAMLEEQGGACAICGVAFDGNPRHRHVDHSHDTGKVRGILCHYCNTLLANAREDADILHCAVVYLATGALP